jgi:TRAP-type C4-dicarboxylate transport system permease small subunit
MGLLLITVSITVLGRLLFKSSGLAWTEEFGRIMLVCVAFAALGIAYRENMHFKVDKIPGVPQAAYRVFDIFSCLVEIGIMLILLIKGLELMWMTRGTITPALEWPVSVFYAPLPFGAVGMMFYSAKKLIFILKGGQINE